MVSISPEGMQFVHPKTQVPSLPVPEQTVSVNVIAAVRKWDQTQVQLCDHIAMFIIKKIMKTFF